jgi:anti-anti-sigma factor
VSQLAQVEATDGEDARLVRVRGEIDLSNANEVMDAIAREVPRDASQVVLDLSATAYLDSSGIAMIFRLAEQLRYRRQDLRLVVPVDAPIRRVVELTDMQRVIPVDDAIVDGPA